VFVVFDSVGYRVIHAIESESVAVEANGTGTPNGSQADV
jgi:hypothetical protein